MAHRPSLHFLAPKMRLPGLNVRLLCSALVFAGLLAGCAAPVHEEDEYRPPPSADAPASTQEESTPGDALTSTRLEQVLALSESPSRLGSVPEGWMPWVIRRDKIRTGYTLANATVDGAPRQVLHAVSRSAASGLWVPASVPAREKPLIRWSWRTDALVAGADVTRAETEDAPTRLVLAFDGNMSSLPLKDQMIAETARLLLGREMPYATLIYTWDGKQPTGTVVANSHSGRVKKLVVESGVSGLGQWRTYQRDYARDYLEAFGEPPGRLIGVGVLTDTDNTRTTAEAWYGDIQLMEAPRSALGEADGITAID